MQKSASTAEAKLNFPAPCGIVSAVNHLISLDEPRGGSIAGERKQLDACTIVIFGASGDLTARKLVPALYHLFKEKQMPAAFRVVGFARREKTDESWRQELRAALDQFSRTKPVDEKVWNDFAKNLFYCHGRFDRRRGIRQAGNAADVVRQRAVARKPFVLSGDFAEPVRRSGRANSPLRPVEQGRFAPGSASWWRSRSATTSPPRRRSTAS